ncbi:hypothetical protein MKW98_010602 [Papaver atlanticum]|uniref:Uncharacterized protein n=1 Tax=Papaver atlanticum TaxID=357466 RepID=A0AAD4S475_9MAGN|nr:hypothetical protein MKW98_010602 [Papaver atlanticum]
MLDLLKWCKRFTELGFSFTGISLTIHECKSIYQKENQFDLYMLVNSMWGWQNLLPVLDSCKANKVQGWYMTSSGRLITSTSTQLLHKSFLDR